MTMTIDYYETLEISRTATEDEIKKAYRRLAREHHPDVNAHRREEAEAKFKEIGTAYAVLSDPQKRQRYDRYGADAANGGGASDFDFGGAVNLNDLFDLFAGATGATGTRAREQVRRGSDVRADITLTLHECYAGVTKEIEVPTLLNCQTCDATGAAPGTKVEPCVACGGTGRLREVRATFFGQFVQETPCARCGGKGKMIPTPCPKCHGDGRVRDKRKLSVQIPAGVDDGDRVRVLGGGEDGAQGAEAGDLYCFVTVANNDHFERRERDVLYALPLSYAQAALGDTIQVPTLEFTPEGEPVYAEITVPAGTQPNSLFRVNGKGFPDRYGRRGDQICVARLLVPRQLNERQKELLREFAELSDERPEEHPRGFFDKLKGAFLGH